MKHPQPSNPASRLLQFPPGGMPKDQPLPGENLVTSHRESYAKCRYVYTFISTINQKLFVKPPVFHCGLPLLVLAGVATSAPSVPSKREVRIAPAHVAGEPGFPLLLKGKEITINPEVKQDELEARLKELIGEKTAMELKSRLQYDVQLDDGVTHMVFDWDDKGRIVQVLIDNPVPTGLMEWLKKTVGPGKEGMEGRGVRTTTWETAAWEFTFREGGSDGDTVFGFEIVPVKGR